MEKYSRPNNCNANPFAALKLFPMFSKRLWFKYIFSNYRYLTIYLQNIDASNKVQKFLTELPIDVNYPGSMVGFNEK